jgi:flagellin
MALTLNTNIDSLNAQNNLTSSQASLSQALERLSSGLRINSAADDAAGLAIAQNLTTQINGSNQAINNANDAVSEAQTAGGALSTIVSNLQSIRTLAVEAANGSNSSSDRAALDQQVQQQIAEITQIASQTTFNGAKILDGSSGVTTYQVGANVGDTIAVDLSQGVRADQIGQVASGNLTVASTSALDGAANGLVISVGNGASVTVGASAATPNAAGTAAAGQTADSAYAKAAAINAAGIAGLTTTASTTVSGVFTTINAATAGTGTPQTAATASTYDLSINGTSIYGGTGNLAVGSSLTAAQVAAQINLYSATDGNVTASVNNNQLVLTASDGQDIALAQTYTAGAAAVVGRQQYHDRRQRGRPGIARHHGGHPVPVRQQDTVGAERVDGGRRQRDHRGGRLGAADGERLRQPVGRHPEPLHGGREQPDGDQPEPDAVAQHPRGCRLRRGNGESHPGASVAAGGYLGVGTGQPGAAIDSQALAVSADALNWSSS